MGEDAGAFAYTNNVGTTTFENVYVSLSSVSEDGLSAGLVADNSLASGSKILAKNCVVYIPETIAEESSFVTNKSTTSNTVTVEKCTFINESKTIVGGNVTNGLINPNSAICGAKAAHITYKANWADVQADAYNQDFKYALLTQENFATYMNVDGTITGLYELAENIDLGSTYYGKANTFAGTLDGNGYTISGIYVPYSGGASAGGLFKTLTGTLKNVSVKGRHDRNSGIIANTCGATSATNITTVIENVYVEAEYLADNAAAPISRHCNGKNVRLVNVVSVLKSIGNNKEPGAVFGGLSKTNNGLTFENCYYITVDGIQPLGTVSGYYGASDVGTLTTFANGLTGYTGATFDEAKTAFDDAVKATLEENCEVLYKMMYPTTTSDANEQTE